MAERRNIGDILIDAGRVRGEDVTRAVEYQRANGGYLGEALVALGCLTREELEWSLASQFDLPYVFPDADSIDPEAAALVSPEWALAHLALPIMRTEGRLMVVVDSPFKSRAVEELQARTDLSVQLALASSWKIRELVRQVYAKQPQKALSESTSALQIEAALGLALEGASRRFGISTRANRIWFWYEEGGTVHRRPLETGWRDGLDQVSSPPPSDLLASQTYAVVETELSWKGFHHPVELRYLTTGAGEEYVFKPSRQRSRMDERFPPPPAGVLAEVRLLARAGSARFLVRAAPEELGRAIVPYLPALLLEPSWRSVHVSTEPPEPPAEDVFSVVAPVDTAEWQKQADHLRTFHFDVVSVDGTGAAPDWVLGALDVASVAFLLADARLDRRNAYQAGVRWQLTIERALGHTLAWSLDPLQA